MVRKNKLIKTADGSHTIYVPELDEHYHSTNGAILESKHIFINAGYRSLNKDEINILEVGFGTGLNALLTLLENEKDNKRVFYTTVEKYPVSSEMLQKLNYPELTETKPCKLFEKIHDAEWGIPVKLTGRFTLCKIKQDIKFFYSEKNFDIIYFDAFGPDKQPEMWSHNIISKIANHTKRKGIFVTYSAKGDLKRNLVSCGFIVNRLPGPPGKREITRAVKT